MERLKTKIKKLPKKPGIYFFKNGQNEIIYIGKALNLKERVKSYLNLKRLDLKTRQMLEQTTRIGYQEASSEFKALLLEAKLIKEHQPKYNVRLKDDKRYLYIAVAQHPFRLFPVRRPELEKELFDWFGPFPSSRAVKEVLRVIRRIFPYCSCRQKPKRQCFYFHLNLCPGFRNLDSEEYQEDIRQIQKILSGQTTPLLKNLKKKMYQTARELKFEEAQRYKKRIVHLENITQGWQPQPRGETQIPHSILKLKKLLVKYQGVSPIILNKIEGFDVSNLGRGIIVGSMVAFVEGQPEKGLYRKFKINFQNLSPNQKISFKKQNDPGSIKEIISRRLNHPEWLYPQLVLVDGGKVQVKAAFEAIKERGLASQIAVLGLAKRKEIIVIPKIENSKITSWKMLQYSQNSSLLMLLQQIRDEAHRFAQKYYRELLLKKLKTS